jgi:hypothetical protein
MDGRNMNHEKLAARVEEIVEWSDKALRKKLETKALPKGKWSGMLMASFSFVAGGMAHSEVTEEDALDETDRYSGHKPTIFVVDNAIKGLRQKLTEILRPDYFGRLDLEIYVVDGLCTMWRARAKQIHKANEMFSR